MKKRLGYLFILLILAGLLAACGLLQEPAEPSAPIEAVPLENEADADTTEADAGAAEETTNEEEANTAVPETAIVEPTVEPEPTAVETEESSSAAAEDSDAPAIYTISQAESQVRFELDEDLRGVRTTVVGTTDQVAGEIGLNLNDLSTAQVGVIQINARTLTTDNNFRNRAIQNEILQTGQYEFITFEPTAVTGLPESAAVGEEVFFSIEGNLTIRDVTQPVTFDVTATAVSESQISGTATAVVSREAFGLQIPNVPNVANVEEEVDLIIDFVANAA